MNQAILWNSQRSWRVKPMLSRLSEPGRKGDHSEPLRDGIIWEPQQFVGQGRQAALTCIQQWDGGLRCFLGRPVGMTRSGTPAHTLANGRSRNTAISHSGDCVLHQEAVCNGKQSLKGLGAGREASAPPIVLISSPTRSFVLSDNLITGDR